MANLTNRDNNLTDILRLPASILIILYHSQLYFNLSGIDLQVIDFTKLLLLSWTMPFFYITATYFSLISAERSESINKVRNKIFTIIKLIIIYYCFYWGLDLIIKFFHQGFVEINLLNISFFEVIQDIRLVHNTPLYWLFDLVFINLVSYFIVYMFIKRNTKVWTFYLLVLLIFVFLFFTEVTIFNGIALLSYIIGLVSYFVFYKHKIIKDYLIKKKTVIFLLLVCIYLIIFGYLNYLFFNGMFLSTDILLTLFSILLFLILSANLLFKFDSKVTFKLSELGRKYSLGVFLFHNAVWLFIENLYLFLLKRGIVPQINVIVLIILYILNISITLIFVKIIYKYKKEFIST